MGSWGTSPVSSDSFGDEFDGVKRKLRPSVDKEVDRKIREALDSGDADQAWSALGMILWAYNCSLLDRDTGKRGYELLEMVEDDPEWRRRWRSPAAINKMLKKVRAQIDGIDMDEAPLLPNALADLLEKGR